MYSMCMCINRRACDVIINGYKWFLFICWCLCGKISVLHPFARLNWLSWPVECSLPRGPSCWICQWITHEPLSAWQGGSNAIADGFIPWSWNVKSWQHIAATLLWPHRQCAEFFSARSTALFSSKHSSVWVNDASLRSNYVIRCPTHCYHAQCGLLVRIYQIVSGHQTGFIQNLSSASCTKLVRARKADRKFCRAAGVQGLPCCICWSVRRW